MKLTDEQINACFESVMFNPEVEASREAIGRAIEAEVLRGITGDGLVEALAPFERLFAEADKMNAVGRINIDCQISVADLRRLAYAAYDLRSAMIASAPMAVVQDGWMPIETAPKDELILVGPTKRMGICVAMHHSRDGWVTETCSEWSNIYTPTHWMPLPAAPKVG